MNQKRKLHKYFYKSSNYYFYAFHCEDYNCCVLLFPLCYQHLLIHFLKFNLLLIILSKAH